MEKEDILKKLWEIVRAESQLVGCHSFNEKRHHQPEYNSIRDATNNIRKKGMCTT